MALPNDRLRRGCVELLVLACILGPVLALGARHFRTSIDAQRAYESFEIVIQRFIPEYRVRHDPALLAGVATIPLTWPEALTAFERSEFVRQYLGDAFTDLYVMTRRGEMEEFNSYISPLDYAWYLTTS